MKTIIRIEHKNGIGIFRNKASHSNDNLSCLLNKLFKRHDKFPIPYDDGNLDIYKDHLNWYCAYKSIEQLKQWITYEELLILINNDFKVLILNISNYQEGTYQILYTKESILNSNDITGFLKFITNY